MWHFYSLCHAILFAIIIKLFIGVVDKRLLWLTFVFQLLMIDTDMRALYSLFTDIIMNIMATLYWKYLKWALESSSNMYEKTVCSSLWLHNSSSPLTVLFIKFGEGGRSIRSVNPIAQWAKRRAEKNDLDHWIHVSIDIFCGCFFSRFSFSCCRCFWIQN